MPKRYMDICTECVTKDARIAALEVERDTARQHAVRWEHEAHYLRREIQAIRMSVGRDTGSFTHER